MASVLLGLIFEQEFHKVPFLGLFYFKCKLFADDTSLFSVVHDISTSASDINNDLKLISNWAFQWKMSFKPDPCKQAQQIIFSRKKDEVSPPKCVFQ